MDLHRALGDAELVGDDLVLMAGAQAAQHVALASGEIVADDLRAASAALASSASGSVAASSASTHWTGCAAAGEASGGRQ